MGTSRVPWVHGTLCLARAGGVGTAVKAPCPPEDRARLCSQNRVGNILPLLALHIFIINGSVAHMPLKHSSSHMVGALLPILSTEGLHFTSSRLREIPVCSPEFLRVSFFPCSRVCSEAQYLQNIVGVPVFVS